MAKLLKLSRSLGLALFALLVGALLLAFTVSIDSPNAGQSSVVSKWQDQNVFLASVPSNPSISAPSNGATAVGINPTLTGSTYSGDPAHQDTDWKIVTTNDCDAGTVVWSSLADGTNLESINLNEFDGDFANTLANYDALSYNTTYYACMRYRNADGVTSWDSNSFTTENLSNWSSNATIRISETSGSTLTSYQVRIPISGLTGVENDGADLRFTDSTSTYGLPHFIADWDSVMNTGVAWVRVPSLSASSVTEIKVYYNDATDQSIQSTSGIATFLEFFDETYQTGWTNGFDGGDSFGTVEASGDWLHFVDSSTSLSPWYGKTLNPETQSETSFTIEHRWKATNGAGTDDFFHFIVDGSTSHRFAQFRAPNYNNQNKFGYRESGTNKNFAGANFVFDTTYETSQVVDGAANQVDYLVYDPERNLLNSQVNENYPDGSPTNPDKIFVGAGGAQTSDYYMDFYSMREFASSEPTATVGDIRVLQALASDNDANGKIDRVEVTFDRDVDLSSVATSDFTFGHTITGVTEPTPGILRLALTEAGSSDTNASPTLTIASTISATDTSSINSGNFTVISANCPTANLANGVITYVSNTTLTATDQTGWNCSGADLQVESGVTLTMAGDLANGYIPQLTVDDASVIGTISANSQGCTATNAQNGYGPNGNNVCTQSTAGGGQGFSSGSGAAGGGGHGGGGGHSNYGKYGGLATASTNWPITFGSSGGSSPTKKGGSGGGAIKLKMNGTLTLDGTISANGQNGQVENGNRNTGAGSGGSILIEADTVQGSGTITATGGNGNNQPGEDSGGGGGGSVVVYASTVSGAFSSFSAANQAAGGTATDNAQGGLTGNYQLNPSKTPTLLRAQTLDTGGNSGQIDEIQLFYNQAIDGNTVVTGDYSLNNSYTISAVNVSGQMVTLTVNESGSTDLGQVITVTHVGSITGLSGTSLSSGSKTVLSASCSYVDGTLGDDDKVIDGTYTVSRVDTTWTPTDTTGEVCTGENLHVTNSRTLTFGTDLTNGYIMDFSADNITIDSGATVSSNNLGCTYQAGGSGHGSGPGVNNVCGYGEDGGGDGNLVAGNVGAAGGGHGGAGGDGTHGTGGVTYDSEQNPVLFGSSGGHVNTAAGGNGGAGGGVIKMTATGTFTLNGSITANGQAGKTYNGNKYSGGGSGGSINLTMDTLTTSANTCSITATGGNSPGDGAERAGAGGGGRIAIKPTTVDEGMTCYESMAASTASAKGTSSQNSSYDGAVGTLYQTALGGVPDTPTNSSPANSATGVSRTPTLQSSAYSGPDSHTSSTWQVDNNSDFSSPEWTANNDTTNKTSIVVNTSNGTFANSLNGRSQLASDTYYFRVLHTNSSGNSAYSNNTSFTTVNNAPTVANLTGSQKTDGSGTVDIAFDLDDADNDQTVQAKIELSIGGGSWTDPTMVEFSGPPALENDDEYQVGGVDTVPGAQTLNVDLTSANFSNTDGTIQFRVTPNDQTTSGTVQTSGNITVDTVDPTIPGSFTNSASTSTSASFTWTTTTETNFTKYQVYYGTNESNVEARTGGDTAVWDDGDDSDLATKATTGTTITGLSQNTTYYAVICALDDYGNQNCLADAVSVAVTSAPSLSSYSAAQNQSDHVAVSVTADDPDDDTLSIKVEYSIDGGSTWGDPTVISNGTVNNSAEYQLQNISTSSGAASVSFTWDADADVASSTDVANARLRLTANDGSNDSSVIGGSTDFELDLVAPTAPGSFVADNPSSGTIDLSWTATTETNFAEYRVLYSTTSGNLTSQWTSSNAANLLTKATTSTTVTGLTAGTQYYFQICAYDDYGHSTCAGEKSATTGSVAVVDSVVASQKRDGSDIVDVSVEFSDADANDVRAKIEFSVDGGQTWTKASLRTGDSYTTASTDDVAVDNAAAYQLGASPEYIDTASGTNTVSFDLVASNFTDVDTKAAYVRVTPNDFGSDGAVVTSNVFTIDVVEPTAPGNLAKEPSIASIMPLTWDPTVESNHDYYAIWYGKSQSKVEAKDTSGVNAAAVHDHDPQDSLLANIETTTTTLVSLDEGATYYAMICAMDYYGNETCSSAQSFVENEPPRAGKISFGRPKSTGRVNVCTRVYDSDNPTAMQLGADYRTGNDQAWSKMTVVSGTVTVSSGSTPGLDNDANYQIGTSGSYIPMTSGVNTVCFDWNYRSDLGSVSVRPEFRFRPYDGTEVGVGGNRNGSVSKPPEARFTVSCEDLVCSFNASTSSGTSSPIQTYAWNFGDATTGTGSTPSHTYDVAGTYSPTLTVTDRNSKKDSFTIDLTVSADEDANPVVEVANVPPVASFIASCNGRVCSFDSSDSSDSDGSISAYAWTFGDGTSSTAASPSKTYTADGTYTVRLGLTDNDGDKDSTYDVIIVETTDQTATVDQNDAPDAAFTYDCNGLSCTFDSSSSDDSDGSISSYLWDFGDVSGSTSANPSHTYSTAKTYTVRLNIVDNEGLESTVIKNISPQASGDAASTDQPPVANFTYTCDALVCSFNASSSSDDNSISNYQWKFNGGNISNGLGATPSNTFTSGGVKMVTLVVTDNAGNRGIHREEIIVVSDDTGGGGGGNDFSAGFDLDEAAPTGLNSLTSPSNTSSTLAAQWSSGIVEENFHRFEIWVGPNKTKVNNRDITGEDGAFRVDEGYDPNMLVKTNTNTTIPNLEEHTVYYMRIWAKDVYNNEVSIADAITQKTNDRADAVSGEESHYTDGTGKHSFAADFGDLDGVNTLTGTYYYNIGGGWQPMTLLTVDADTGTPVIEGNTVGGASGYIPNGDGTNEVEVVWDTQADLGNIDTSNAQIRVIPNDTIENGEPLIIQDVIVDNKAPAGLGNPSATLVSNAPRAVASNPPQGLFKKIQYYANDFMTSIPMLFLAESSESVTVSWSPVDDESNWSGIAAYWIDYGTDSGSLTQTWDKTDDSSLSTMATSSTTITGLTSGTTYYFEVNAQDAYGNVTTLGTVSVNTTSGEVGNQSGSVGGSGGGGVLYIPDEFEFEYELPEHWAAEYIEELLTRDYVLDAIEDDDRVLEFVEDLLENPDRAIEREESVLLLSLITDQWPKSSYEVEDLSVFSDVDDSNELYDIIFWNKEEGRIDGHPDGTFKPDGVTQRVEALKIIAEFVDAPVVVPPLQAYVGAVDIFSDVDPKGWYAPYLEYAIENEIVHGYGDGSFGPANNVTMAEILKMALLTSDIN